MQLAGKDDSTGGGGGGGASVVDVGAWVGTSVSVGGGGGGVLLGGGTGVLVGAGGGGGWVAVGDAVVPQARLTITTNVISQNIGLNSDAFIFIAPYK